MTPFRTLIIGLFALAGTILAIPGAEAQLSRGQDRATGCRESGPLPNQIRCFLEAAEEAGDVGLCDGAYDFAVRFNCVTKFAENAGDAIACERIPIRNNRLLYMRDSCISGVAAATRTPELCETAQLALVRDTCLMMQVVEYDAEADLCERIGRKDLRKICQTGPETPR